MGGGKRMRHVTALAVEARRRMRKKRVDVMVDDRWERESIEVGDDDGVRLQERPGKWEGWSMRRQGRGGVGDHSYSKDIPNSAMSLLVNHRHTIKILSGEVKIN